MPPVRPKTLRQAELLDPLPSTMHVVDMHRDHDNHIKRLSDHAFGMLWYGLMESAITQTDVCDFRMAFEPHLRIRPGRVHEGNALFGPDGKVLTIRGEVYNGGNDSLDVSDLISSSLFDHPKYKQWISDLLYCSGPRKNSLHHAAIMSGDVNSPAITTIVEQPSSNSSTKSTTKSTSRSTRKISPTKSEPAADATTSLLRTFTRYFSRLFDSDLQLS